MDNPKELAVIDEKVAGMQKMLDQLPVVNDEQYAMVAERIAQVKQLGRIIKDEKDKYTAPANEIIKQARTTFDPLIAACQNAVSILNGRAIKYHEQKQAEIKKKEDQISARVEKGTMKVETAAKKLETLPEVKTTVRTDTGIGLQMAKVAVANITNPDLIPDEFWVIDEAKVRREALQRHKAGADQIPGVTIEIKTQAKTV